MSKQDEFNELMDLIHSHYPIEKIDEFILYSNMIVDETPETSIIININTYGN